MSKHTSPPDAKFLEQKARGLAAALLRSKPRSDLPRRGRHGHHNVQPCCGARPFRHLKTCGRFGHKAGADV